MQYPKTIATGFIGLWLLALGLGLRRTVYHAPLPPCFVQIERRDGWEQREISCNYRPDSASHEWKTIKTLTAVNDSNPFNFSNRHQRRFGR